MGNGDFSKNAYAGGKLEVEQLASADTVAQWYYKCASCWMPRYVERLEKEAVKGSLLAVGFLVRLHLFDASFVKKDLKKATTFVKEYSLIKWLEDQVADENSESHVYAYFILGACHSKGVVVEMNTMLAYQYYLAAAIKGYTCAQNAVAKCYRQGHGVEYDLEQAVKWFNIAACANHAEAQYHLGNYYEHGTGVAADAKEALRWYKSSAEQGNALSLYHLGWFYRHGIGGLEKNRTTGMRLLLFAAEKGHAEAQYMVGVAYDNEEESILAIQSSYNGTRDEDNGRKEYGGFTDIDATYVEDDDDYSDDDCDEDEEDERGDSALQLMTLAEAHQTRKPSTEVSKGEDVIVATTATTTQLSFNASNRIKVTKSAANMAVVSSKFGAIDITSPQQTPNRRTTANSTRKDHRQTASPPPSSLSSATHFFSSAASPRPSPLARTSTSITTSSNNNNYSNQFASPPAAQPQRSASFFSSSVPSFSLLMATASPSTSSAVATPLNDSSHKDTVKSNNSVDSSRVSTGVAPVVTAIAVSSASASSTLSPTQTTKGMLVAESINAHGDATQHPGENDGQLYSLLYFLVPSERSSKTLSNNSSVIKNKGKPAAALKSQYYTSTNTDVQAKRRTPTPPPLYRVLSQRNKQRSRYYLALDSPQQRACYWYTLAAFQGHAGAQCNLGYSYYTGEGLARGLQIDEQKAFRLYLLSAQQGHAEGQYNVALCYKQGTTLLSSPSPVNSQEEAIKYFQLSAKQGHAPAQYEVGLAYLRGEISSSASNSTATSSTTKPDTHFSSEQEAFVWFQLAATGTEQHYAPAQYALSRCYEHGWGVRQSAQDALHWCCQAAENAESEPDQDALFRLAQAYNAGDSGLLGLRLNVHVSSRVRAVRYALRSAHAVDHGEHNPRTKEDGHKKQNDIEAEEDEIFALLSSYHSTEAGGEDINDGFGGGCVQAGVFLAQICQELCWRNLEKVYRQSNRNASQLQGNICLQRALLYQRWSWNYALCAAEQASSALSSSPLTSVSTSIPTACAMIARYIEYAHEAVGSAASVSDSDSAVSSGVVSASNASPTANAAATVEDVLRMHLIQLAEATGYSLASPTSPVTSAAKDSDPRQHHPHGHPLALQFWYQTYYTFHETQLGHSLDPLQALDPTPDAEDDRWEDLLWSLEAMLRLGQAAERGEWETAPLVNRQGTKHLHNRSDKASTVTKNKSSDNNEGSARSPDDEGADEETRTLQHTRLAMQWYTEALRIFDRVPGAANQCDAQGGGGGGFDNRGTISSSQSRASPYQPSPVVHDSMKSFMTSQLTPLSSVFMDNIHKKDYGQNDAKDSAEEPLPWYFPLSPLPLPPILQRLQQQTTTLLAALQQQQQRSKLQQQLTPTKDGNHSSNGAYLSPQKGTSTGTPARTPIRASSATSNNLVGVSSSPLSPERMSTTQQHHHQQQQLVSSANTSKSHLFPSPSPSPTVNRTNPDSNNIRSTTLPHEKPQYQRCAIRLQTLLTLYVRAQRLLAQSCEHLGEVIGRALDRLGDELGDRVGGGGGEEGECDHRSEVEEDDGEVEEEEEEVTSLDLEENKLGDLSSSVSISTSTSAFSSLQKGSQLSTSRQIESPQKKGPASKVVPAAGVTEENHKESDKKERSSRETAATTTTMSSKSPTKKPVSSVSASKPVSETSSNSSINSNSSGALNNNNKPLLKKKSDPISSTVTAVTVARRISRSSSMTIASPTPSTSAMAATRDIEAIKNKMMKNRGEIASATTASSHNSHTPGGVVRKKPPITTATPSATSTTVKKKETGAKASSTVSTASSTSVQNPTAVSTSASSSSSAVAIALTEEFCSAESETAASKGQNRDSDPPRTPAASTASSSAVLSEKDSKSVSSINDDGCRHNIIDKKANSSINDSDTHNVPTESSSQSRNSLSSSRFLSVRHLDSITAITALTSSSTNGSDANSNRDHMLRRWTWLQREVRTCQRAAFVGYLRSVVTYFYHLHMHLHHASCGTTMPTRQTQSTTSRRSRRHRKRSRRKGRRHEADFVEALHSLAWYYEEELVPRPLSLVQQVSHVTNASTAQNTPQLHGTGNRLYSNHNTPGAAGSLSNAGYMSTPLASTATSALFHNPFTPQQMPTPSQSQLQPAIYRSIASNEDTAVLLYRLCASFATSSPSYTLPSSATTSSLAKVASEKSEGIAEDDGVSESSSGEEEACEEEDVVTEDAAEASERDDHVLLSVARGRKEKRLSIRTSFGSRNQKNLNNHNANNRNIQRYSRYMEAHYLDNLGTLFHSLSQRYSGRKNVATNTHDETKNVSADQTEDCYEEDDVEDENTYAESIAGLAADAHYSLGNASEHGLLGVPRNTTRAMVHYEACLTLDASHAEANYALAMLHLEQRERVLKQQQLWEQQQARLLQKKSQRRRSLSLTNDSALSAVEAAMGSPPSLLMSPGSNTALLCDGSSTPLPQTPMVMTTSTPGTTTSTQMGLSSHAKEKGGVAEVVSVEKIRYLMQQAAEAGHEEAALWLQQHP